MGQQRTIEKEYDAKLDNKRRVVLRKPQDNDTRTQLRETYHVRHYSNGVIELRPQIKADVASISRETLEMIERSAENLQEGVASEPVDLDEDFPDL